VFRRNWRELGFWRWWWREEAPQLVRAGAYVLALAALLGGGLFAAGKLGTSHAEAGPNAVVRVETLKKLVTVRDHGVVRTVPVYETHRVYKTKTDVSTAVVTAPGAPGRRVVKYVPVVHSHTVTAGGVTSTVRETTLVPTVRTRTATNVVTTDRTVTNTNTRVQTSTVVSNHTVTTSVPVTTTVVKTETKTETQTQTQTVTETAPTVTITVPLP